MKSRSLWHDPISPQTQDPENGTPLFSANPESYNLKALYSVLLLHRYSLPSQSFLNYISEASNILLNSISLLDEPEYARFFLLPVSTCSNVPWNYHISIWGLSSNASPPCKNQERTFMLWPPWNMYARVCLQYFLTTNVGEALDDARKSVNETCRASLISYWISGDTRTKVILAHLIRNRIELFVPEEDLMPIVRASLELLNGMFIFIFSSLA